MARSIRGAVGMIILFASSSVSAQLFWEPVVGGGAATGVGFGDSNNRIALSMATFGADLYVGTYNEITGSEVWRSGNGTSWTQVTSDNFGQNIVTNINYGAYSMSVFSGYLYAGTWGGFVAADDTRLFRTNTGTSWIQANTDGFGNGNNAEPLDHAEFNGLLYIGVANHPEGAEMMQSHNGANWVQSGSNGFGDTDNIEFSAMTTDGTTLWVATGNMDTGVEIWAMTSGVGWYQANTDGFDAADNQAAYAMEVFGDALYVATYNGSTGMEIWRFRSTDMPQWTRVVNGGFGDSGNLGSYAMRVFDGALFVGTYNAAGAEIWSTQNGTVWVRVNDNGFGSSSNYSVMSLEVHDDALYAGTARGSGAEIWRFKPAIFADGFESGDMTLWSTP